MLAALVLLGAHALPVRAELVEAPLFSREEKNSPSTSSGRTEEGKGSVIDAERRFAADAQTLGQWAAFRKWAAPDATMFVPQPVRAQDWLKDRKDPAKAIDWWPTAVWISCDGTVAVDTGGWKRPDGSVGYFTTVWQRQPDGGWRWIVDGGDQLQTGRDRPAKPKVVFASCNSKPTEAPRWIVEHQNPRRENGISVDGSLAWEWLAYANGSRKISSAIWTGSDWSMVLDDNIPAPPK